MSPGEKERLGEDVEEEWKRPVKKPIVLDHSNVTLKLLDCYRNQDHLERGCRSTKDACDITQTLFMEGARTSPYRTPFPSIIARDPQSP